MTPIKCIGGRPFAAIAIFLLVPITGNAQRVPVNQPIQQPTLYEAPVQLRTSTNATSANTAGIATHRLSVDNELLNNFSLPSGSVAISPARPVARPQTPLTGQWAGWAGSVAGPSRFSAVGLDGDTRNSSNDAPHGSRTAPQQLSPRSSLAGLQNNRGANRTIQVTTFPSRQTLSDNASNRYFSNRDAASGSALPPDSSAVYSTHQSSEATHTTVSEAPIFAAHSYNTTLSKRPRSSAGELFFNQETGRFEFLPPSPPAFNFSVAFPGSQTGQVSLSRTGAPSHQTTNSSISTQRPVTADVGHSFVNNSRPSYAPPPFEWRLTTKPPSRLDISAKPSATSSTASPSVAAALNAVTLAAPAPPSLIAAPSLVQTPVEHVSTLPPPPSPTSLNQSNELKLPQRWYNYTAGSNGARIWQTPTLPSLPPAPSIPPDWPTAHAYSNVSTQLDNVTSPPALMLSRPIRPSAVVPTTIATESPLMTGAAKHPLTELKSDRETSARDSSTEGSQIATVTSTETPRAPKLSFNDGLWEFSDGQWHYNGTVWNFINNFDDGQWSYSQGRWRYKGQEGSSGGILPTKLPRYKQKNETAVSTISPAEESTVPPVSLLQDREAPGITLAVEISTDSATRQRGTPSAQPLEVIEDAKNEGKAAIPRSEDIVVVSPETPINEPKIKPRNRLVEKPTDKPVGSGTSSNESNLLQQKSRTSGVFHDASLGAPANLPVPSVPLATVNGAPSIKASGPTVNGTLSANSPFGTPSQLPLNGVVNAPYAGWAPPWSMYPTYDPWSALLNSGILAGNPWMPGQPLTVPPSNSSRASLVDNQGLSTSEIARLPLWGFPYNTTYTSTLYRPYDLLTPYGPLNNYRPGELKFPPYTSYFGYNPFMWGPYGHAAQNLIPPNASYFANRNETTINTDSGQSYYNDDDDSISDVVTEIPGFRPVISISPPEVLENVFPISEVISAANMDENKLDERDFDINEPNDPGSQIVKEDAGPNNSVDPSDMLFEVPNAEVFMESPILESPVVLPIQEIFEERLHVDEVELLDENTNQDISFGDSPPLGRTVPLSTLDISSPAPVLTNAAFSVNPLPLVDDVVNIDTDAWSQPTGTNSVIDFTVPQITSTHSPGPEVDDRRVEIPVPNNAVEEKDDEIPVSATDLSDQRIVPDNGSILDGIEVLEVDDGGIDVENDLENFEIQPYPSADEIITINDFLAEQVFIVHTATEPPNLFDTWMPPGETAEHQFGVSRSNSLVTPRPALQWVIVDPVTTTPIPTTPIPTPSTENEAPLVVEEGILSTSHRSRQESDGVMPVASGDRDVVGQQPIDDPRHFIPIIDATEESVVVHNPYSTSVHLPDDDHSGSYEILVEAEPLAQPQPGGVAIISEPRMTPTQDPYVSEEVPHHVNEDERKEAPLAAEGHDHREQFKTEPELYETSKNTSFSDDSISSNIDDIPSPLGENIVVLPFSNQLSATFDLSQVEITGLLQQRLDVGPQVKESPLTENVSHEGNPSKRKDEQNSMEVSHLSMSQLADRDGDDWIPGTVDYVTWDAYDGDESPFEASGVLFPAVAKAYEYESLEEDTYETNDYVWGWSDGMKSIEQAPISNRFSRTNYQHQWKTRNRTGLIPIAFAELDQETDSSPFKPEEESRTVELPRHYSDEMALREPVRPREVGAGATPYTPTGVFLYCYPFVYDEVVDKCSKALEQNGVTGVYLPLMMEIQERHEPLYYNKVKELRSKTGLSVIGVSYENPKWDLIASIVKDYSGLFNGIILEWVGPRACVKDMRRPTEHQLATIRQHTEDGIIRYFMRDQNVTKCGVTQPVLLKPRAEVPLETKLLPFPDYVQPVFACYAGQEGLCFRTFTKYPHLACDATQQRFSFNPYEGVGGRMMHLVNETCRGMPPHDLYGTL